MPLHVAKRIGATILTEPRELGKRDARTVTKAPDLHLKKKDSAQYKLSARVTELSNLLSPSLKSKNQPSTDPEINTTLQFALLAMEEAEKQKKRFIESNAKFNKNY